MDSLSFAILTVSDSCYANVKEDRSGSKLAEAVKQAFPNCSILTKEIVPDVQNMISIFLVQWSSKNCDVILTTGGTGLSLRDVTPEATRSVIDKEVPGLSYAMLSKSLAITDMAMLSRAVCGIRGQTLIINLPGSVKAATECFGFIKLAIPHAVSLLKENHQQVARTHEHVQNPKPTSPSKVKSNQVAFRKRVSPYPMHEVSAALQIIFNICPKGTETELIVVSKSLGRVLSEDIYAMDPLPPFNASIKDGYAVRYEDGMGHRNVRDVVAAGDKPLNTPLTALEVMRINTGAPIPEGANAVVQVEDTELHQTSKDGSKELSVYIKVQAKPFQDIRLIGSDIAKNSLVVEKQQIITSGLIGVLATVGKTKVNVYRRPSVCIISTGNELQDPCETLKPGHIRDSNKLAMISLLNQYGFTVEDCGVAKDNPDSVKSVLEQGLLKHDVIITTGGVSMGEFDIVKDVLQEDFGATIHFARVNMKPGKPTAFATCQFNEKLKMVFALPGNPVSAMVTCILFVIPALRHIENRNSTVFPQIPVELASDVALDPRPEYIRVHLKNIKGNKILRGYPVGNQISSRINSFVGASALLQLPSSKAHGDICEAGEILQALVLEPLSITLE